MNVNEIKKIVRDYDWLYDEVMKYAQKRYLPTDNSRYFLTDLHFNFYKENNVSIIERDVADEGYFEERTFSLDTFLDYYNKKIAGEMK